MDDPRTNAALDRVPCRAAIDRARDDTPLIAGEENCVRSGIFNVPQPLSGNLCLDHLPCRAAVTCAENVPGFPTATPCNRGAEAIQHSVAEMAKTPCKLNQVGIGACFFHGAVADDAIDTD